MVWDKYNQEEKDDDEEEEAEEEGDEDEMEDAMYTRRMNFTGDWIVNHSRSNSNSAINLSLMMYDEYGLGETHMTTDKEYGRESAGLLICIFLLSPTYSTYRPLPPRSADNASATERFHLLRARLWLSDGNPGGPDEARLPRALEDELVLLPQVRGCLYQQVSVQPHGFPMEFFIKPIPFYL